MGFVADTARDSSSEGKHRSELDSGVFSNTERNRVQSTTCSAEEPTQLQGRIATEIWPRGRGHREDGHEEEILQADSDTKKEKVTNKHHQRIRTRVGQLPAHVACTTGPRTMFKLVHPLKKQD